jgi:predicted metal-dependent HD superfamily phosphohydrolase
MDTANLFSPFEAAATLLGARRDVRGVFTQLEARYREPHRAYHALSHIAHGLELFIELETELAAPGEVLLAWWFHDAIYATHPLANNESRSASLAYEQCLRMGIPEPTADRVARLVRMTERHQSTGPDDRDAALLLDVDLSILGADPLTYATFERDVRAEYRWLFLEGIYRRGRARVLEGFLRRGSIYAHPRTRARYEAAARANLARAIEELRAEDDEPRLHATDEHVFWTRAARLEEAHPWSDLYFATYHPATPTRAASFGVSFGPFDDRRLQVGADDPRARELVDRLRSLPSYRRDEEAKAGTFPALVYSRERCGVVSGPVPLPPARAGGPGEAYRG